MLTLLELLSQKIKPNGIVFFQKTFEEFGVKDTALQDFFKGLNITTKEYK